MVISFQIKYYVIFFSYSEQQEETVNAHNQHINIIKIFRNVHLLKKKQRTQYSQYKMSRFGQQHHQTPHVIDRMSLRPPRSVV